MKNGSMGGRMTEKMRTAITVLLICSLVFVNGTAVTYAASASASGTDTATMLLVSMGVLSADSSGSYDLSKTVTRAEFAKMIVMASSYKDLVKTTSYSSPYKDVPAKNWAAPYIRIAVSKGLMTGYSNGTFRPGSPITLEQAVNSALKLLGYAKSDFTGAFPYAQMNVYSSNGLSENIVGGVGTLLTKSDAANLIYNLMGTTLKDGSKTYAETLGYSLNDSGEVNYADVISSNMIGPYTVKSGSWASELGMNSASLTVYKNGSVVTVSDVKNYDILYYSHSKGTVWVYDDKVTGVYESASPSQNAPTSVTVSGTEYNLESSAAFSALSSTGTLKTGSAVTLLLGKNGGVADAVSSTVANDSAVVYVTETGTKTYTNASGSQYTSFYFKGVKPSGAEIEYATTQKWIEPGDMLDIRFDSDGDMTIGRVSSGGRVSGVVDADLYTIGTTGVSTSVKILDTNLGNYTATSLARLDGVKLDADDILYYEASGGKVNMLILKDVTGDTAKYGVLTSAKSGDSSGSYTYLIGGVSATLTTQNGTLGAHAGPVKLYGESGKIALMKNLYSVGTKVKTFTGSQVTVSDDIGTYPVSANVAVYTNASGSYKVSTLSAALTAFQSKKSVTFFYDKDPEDGGCIRVIVY
jgi:hypothetical protein